MKQKISQKLKIQPLSDWLFIKWEKQKESKSGVVVADISKSKPAIATVLSIGPGKIDRHGNFIKTSLKVNDKIVIDPFLPQVIKIGGEDYWVIRESDIYAKIN